MSESITNDDKITWQEFYNKLGYLYYGIAAAAGPVDADTLLLLRKSVSRIWMLNGAELVEFQGYTPNKVDALFDWLSLNETEWEYCVNEFAYFANTHQKDMPTHMREFAINSADEISRFMGEPNNPAIAKLKEMLKPAQ